VHVLHTYSIFIAAASLGCSGNLTVAVTKGSCHQGMDTYEISQRDFLFTLGLAASLSARYVLVSGPALVVSKSALFYV
jgi:hypothetical protein